MDNLKVSVIIPVFNSEKYLDKLFRCFVKQTLQSIEFICINDGSTDRSIDIIMYYKKILGEKLKIINTPGLGVWKARKMGLKYAKGEYVAFCDSDDYIEKNIYEKMYHSAKTKDADIVICGFDRIDGSTGKVMSREMNRYDNLIITPKNKKWIFALINTALWNKMIKRDILEKSIDFLQPPRVMEDTMLLMSIYPYINTLIFCSEILYHYVVRDGTAMTYIKEDEIDLLCKDMVITRNYVSESCNKPDLLPVIDVIAFIHLGISMPLKLLDNQEIHNKVIAIKKFLNKNFPEFKMILYSKMKYQDFKYFWKIIITLRIFKTRYYVVFLKLYRFVIEKLKFEIKW